MERRINWRTAYLGLATLVLLVPFLVMLVTPSVQWGLGDFLAAALLLGATGLGVEMVVRVVHKPLYRWAAIGGVILLALLIWAELAVGIFR